MAFPLVVLYHRLWRWFIFKTGDTHLEEGLPWFSTTVPAHRVSQEEVEEALEVIRFGDIGLSRHVGYLSNCGITGFMKHAWLFTDDRQSTFATQPRVVEAVSDGVLYRSPVTPLAADFSMIVRPRNVSEHERRAACRKAREIVSCGYDDHFEFDLERELKFFQGQDAARAKKHLQRGEEHIRKYIPLFTCTEVVAYAWWHVMEKLGLKKKLCWGKKVILADQFISPKFEIVWMSGYVSPRVARLMGLDEVGVEMIREFRRAHPPQRHNPYLCLPKGQDVPPEAPETLE